MAAKATETEQNGPGNFWEKCAPTRDSSLFHGQVVPAIEVTRAIGNEPVAG